ncbi:putative mediator of RNA polymerase II transcription subunit 26 isoform X1 [Schistocerca americana]|uniref:putative mediator of RNA polymerase II transcription subunit 26 isoform X1 n=3 Tax=Schistocerca americana TaxID=7009 RepID=UPI001F4FC64E|nr:putative mediator of RNA polymerase II transcription subunit 26 isoform X1 [Schistocerca americana]
MDWRYSSEDELSALDGINEQTQNLERAVLRENEININLRDVLQKMRAEIKATEEQLSTYREDIKATLNRQRIVENSIQSTNDSSLLVEKLRCDLKKQVTLEQIRTEEQTERYQNIVTKYEKLWNGYEAVYNLFPMVPERNNLQLRIKRLEIIVVHKRKLLESEKAKKNQIEAIREQIMQLKIVQFIKLILQHSSLHQKYSTLKEKIKKIQEEIDKKRKEITEIQSKLPCEKEKTVSVKQIESVQKVGLPHTKVVPAVQSPNVTSDMDQKMTKKVPKARDLTKNLLFSPLEMTHIELPQLKLPVFDSPPRKVQRTSRLLSRPIRLFPEYSFQEKEPSTEDATLECTRNEAIPLEVNRERNELVLASEITIFEDHMEVEETQDMEQVTSTFSRTPVQTQSQHQLEQQQQQQKQLLGQQGEQEQSHLMHQQVHEQRQDDQTHILQDLQTSEQLQQQQQQQQQLQPLQEQCFWQQEEHQQDKNDPQQCQNEAPTEHVTDMQTDDEPAGEMRSSSQPLSDNSDICDMHHIGHDESFDSTSERARREFLSKVTKSPEFMFIPRKDLNTEEVDKGDDVQIDTRSQYFLNPLQSCSEQRTVTEQERQQEATKQQNVVPQDIGQECSESAEDLRAREHTGGGVSPRETETNMEGSDDLLAVSFHSLSPPEEGIGMPLSPPSSQAQGHAGNQGFMFSFAPQSSGSIMSLFGEGEPNQEQEDSSVQQKKSEAFTFTFNKKTKSSSFFKLF